MLAFVACAAYAVPASAATTIGAPLAEDPTANSFSCPWGFASETDDGLTEFGQVVTAPDADTVIDSFSFYVTRLRELDALTDSEVFVGEPQSITYRAYVAKGSRDPETGALITEPPLWESDDLTVTTSTDPAQWKTTVQTGGVQLEPGQLYALYFSTRETNAAGWNTVEDRGCGVLTNTHPYEFGTSLVRYLSDPDFRTGLFFAADNAFEATFSAPAPQTIYEFDGFYAPVNNKDADGNYVLNAVSAGSAIPVKFSLGGDYGLDVFEAGYPRSQVITCDSQAQVDGIEETVTAGASTLTYDAATGVYHYVWKTEKAWEDTCRQLVVKFDDGTTARANFLLK